MESLGEDITEDAPASTMTDPVLTELERIFGKQSTEASRGFVSLPLLDEMEALDFLRTVPAGTSLGDLVHLAAEFRGSNPVDGRGGLVKLASEEL